MGLVGEQSGFLMTNGRGFCLRTCSASKRLRATCDCGKGTLKSRQSLRAKSRSRSILIASRVGEKMGTFEASNSSCQGAWAQSIDIGTTSSTPCCLSSGTGEGNWFR